MRLNAVNVGLATVLCVVGCAGAARADPRQCGYYYTMKYLVADEIPASKGIEYANAVLARCGKTKAEKEIVARGGNEALDDAKLMFRYGGAHGGREP